MASKAGNSLTGLVAPPGLPALRRRIAGLMLSRGVACGPEEVLITSGDIIALELALEAAAPKGATVAIETPTYYGILQTIERLGMRALPIATDTTNGINVDHLEEALRQKKVAVIFLNPTLQNPRGFIMPNEARARLSQLACAANVPIIEDDIFFDLVPDNATPRAIKSYDTTGQTIYCSSFDRSHAPAWECSLRRSASASQADAERPDRRYPRGRFDASTWERSRRQSRRHHRLGVLKNTENLYLFLPQKTNHYAHRSATKLTHLQLFTEVPLDVDVQRKVSLRSDSSAIKKTYLPRNINHG